MTPTVYFIRAMTLGLIKIGYATDFRDRLKTLQVCSPDRLELVGAIYSPDALSIERDLHFRFAQHREHGEWFRPADELLAFIADNPVARALAAEAADFEIERERANAIMCRR